MSFFYSLSLSLSISLSLGFCQQFSKGNGIVKWIEFDDVNKNEWGKNKIPSPEYSKTSSCRGAVQSVNFVHDIATSNLFLRKLVSS